MSHEFGREFGIKFNPEKSQFLSYGCQIEGVYLDGLFVTCQYAAKHLGHMIFPMKNDSNIDLKSKELFPYLNHIIAVFGNSNYKVKYKLLRSFCMPLYGCVLWDYTCKDIERTFISWRKCIRQLLFIPQ